MKYIEMYQRFILNTNPSRGWKILRAILHWITLPLKLLIIGGVSYAMRIYMLTWKTRKMPPFPKDFEDRAKPVRRVYQNLPVFRSENIELYASRVPTNALPDGENHNTDHQGGRHGTYAFLLSRLGLRNPAVDEALRLHMRGKYGFIRGYKKNKYVNGQMQLNARSVAGDQILGICLAMLDVSRSQPSIDENGSLSFNADFSGQDNLIESFDQAVSSIIENDYANIDLNPMDDFAKKEFQKTLNAVKAPELVKIKSARSMWQPGLETVGAQTLTILAILKTAAVKTGSRSAQKHYDRLVWQYGYAILAYFPTTFIPGRRTYFNDHNCIVAAYILAKLSDKGTWGRWYWERVALNIWKMSRKYYNGYFTGLVRDLNPDLIPVEHVVQCLNYLYEEEPLLYSQYHSDTIEKYPKEYPVKYNDMNTGGEFHPDEAHVIKNMRGPAQRNGLGWLAHLIMLDPEEARKYLGR